MKTFLQIVTLVLVGFNGFYGVKTFEEIQDNRDNLEFCMAIGGEYKNGYCDEWADLRKVALND